MSSMHQETPMKHSAGAHCGSGLEFSCLRFGESVSPNLSAELGALHAQCFSDGDAWSSDAFSSLIRGGSQANGATGGLYILCETRTVAESSSVYVPFAEERGARMARVVGALIMRTIARETEILTLAVAKDKRRLHVAEWLIEMGLEDAAKAHSSGVFLEVAEDNCAACSLYSKLGFVQVGRRPGYYSGNRAALVLEKKL